MTGSIIAWTAVAGSFTAGERALSAISAITAGAAVDPAHGFGYFP